MTDAPRREHITVGDVTIKLDRSASPVDLENVVAGQELFHFLSVFDERLRPENYAKADGAPLRLFSGDSVRVDLSKRSVEDMGFWHRSADFNEIIMCIRGALRWETELGSVVLREGQMIWISRGVAHRSMLCEESADENVLLELKIREDLDYVADL